MNREQKASTLFLIITFFSGLNLAAPIYEISEFEKSKAAAQEMFELEVDRECDRILWLIHKVRLDLEQKVSQTSNLKFKALFMQGIKLCAGICSIENQRRLHPLICRIKTLDLGKSRHQIEYNKRFFIAKIAELEARRIARINEIASYAKLIFGQNLLDEEEEENFDATEDEAPFSSEPLADFVKRTSQSRCDTHQS